MKSAIAKIFLAAMTLLSLNCAATGVLAAPAEAEKSGPPSTVSVPILRPTLLPDGVADEDGKFAYLRNADDGIDAIEIATGKTKWTTKIIAKPLFALKDRLITQVPVEGQANALKIAVMDKASGKQLLLSETLVFPDWVVVAAEEGAIHGKTFLLQALVKNENVSLLWRATSYYAGGAAPPIQIYADGRQKGGGFFAVNTKTGHHADTDQHLKNLHAHPYIYNSNPPKIVHIANTVYVSIDGKYALTKAKDTTEDADGTWAVVSRTNSEKIGEVVLGTELDSFAVLDSKIFWVTSTQPAGGRMKPQTIERELTVAEIATGKVLWKRALKPKQIAPLPM